MDDDERTVASEYWKNAGLLGGPPKPPTPEAVEVAEESDGEQLDEWLAASKKVLGHPGFTAYAGRCGRHAVVER